jgi:hypothetical protein
VKDQQNNDTGWIPGAVWNSSVPSQPPVVLSGSPVTATGSPQIFTFQVRDPNGAVDLRRLYFQIHGSPTVPVNTCHGFWDSLTNALYLYNDALTALLGPLTPGTAGTLQNSQCVINGASSSIALNGYDATLRLGASLTGAYGAVSQNVYLWAKDRANQDTGWVQTSTWFSSVPSQPPVISGTSPVTATGIYQQNLVQARDPNGYTDIRRLYFLVNTDTSIPAGTCHGFHDQAANALYLYNDSLTALMGPLALGTAGTLQNSQCTIHGSTSRIASASGTVLTFQLGISLLGAYSTSQKNYYFWAKDAANQDTGWVLGGSWFANVPSQPPVVLPGTPVNPTGSPQVFEFKGRDPNGYTNIFRLYFVVNNIPGVSVNGCHGFYDQLSNALYLYNDSLTGLIGPVVPGTQSVLQNSQCRIDGASSSIPFAAGTDLTVRVGISLLGSFGASNQNVYVWVKDQQNQDTGWWQVAVWKP